MPRTASRATVNLPQGGVITALGRAILDGLDRGVILLDARGRILDGNTHALQVLRNCSGFAVRAGRFVFTDSELDDRLQRVLRQTAPYRNGRAVLATRVRCRGHDPYRIVIRPVPPGSNERNVAFFAIIYAPNGSRGISLHVLCDLYGLTPAQAAVARKLFAGLNLEEAAQALGLSLNTVRTHLKQVFTRCEVNSQAELLHLLAMGPHEL